VFFDVGAHVGLISFAVGARCPGARIHAFEPHPENAVQWRRNRNLNPEVSAVLNEVAVGGEEGTVWLVPWAFARGESGCQHVKAEKMEGALEVQQLTLDRYTANKRIRCIDVLKLDIEGYEPFALEGCRRLLGEHRIRCIVTELSKDYLADRGSSVGAVRALLADCGFREEPMPTLGLRRLRSNWSGLDTAYVVD
jgi:FkbM family methyltransferase